MNKLFGTPLTRRSAGRLAVGATLGVAAAPVTVGPTSAAPASAAGRTGIPAGRADVDALIRAMTLEEKVSLLHGATDPASVGQAGYLPGVPRLGIPEVRLADGPAGVRVTRNATALPAPVALAATFSREVATAFGRVIGVEGRALGVDVLLSPMTNVVRVPEAGRNFETLGEDPLLAGTIVAAEVRGIQSQGLIATVKHYAANNFENGRQTVDARIDDRTLREIYLPAFESAVDAGVGAAMAAYNRVNGVYAAENPILLTEVLREDWGFSGWVMSDWYATHGAGPALTAGMDMEMPSGLYYSGLVAAVRGGAVAESVVDTAVRRILTQLRRFGLLGGVRARPTIDPAAHARVARDVALAGAVLLRNEGGLLPLDHTDLRALAVIGPTARNALVGGAGSARVIPARAESPLAALIRRAGPGAAITYAAGVDLDGVPVPASALSLTRTGSDGTSQPDARVDHTGAAALPAGSSWTWTGTLTPAETGDHDLRIQGAGGVSSFGGSITLTLDGTRIGAVGALFGGNNRLIPTAGGLTNAGTTVKLEAGVARKITITAAGAPGTPLQVRLAWVPPRRRQETLDEAVRVARSARTAVVFAFNEGTEGQDRPGLALPDGQDALVTAVVGANRRTVVVLNTGDPVLLPWVARTPSVLQMWYPGQEGGDATVSLLLGAANPGGKLPVTYPRREQDGATESPQRYPGVDGRAEYSEGIFVGYRHFDANGIEPLFPFGHGLSYTRFAFSRLAVRRQGDGLKVSFVLSNVGDRRGAEVPQVYLTPPDGAPVPMARRHLAGFARVTLEPGERRWITITIPVRALSYWSTGRGRWAVATGRRQVLVGASSRDIRLREAVTIR